MKGIAALDLTLFFMLFILTFPIAATLLAYFRAGHFSSFLKLAAISIVVSIGLSSSITFFLGVFSSLEDFQEVELSALERLKEVDSQFFGAGNPNVSCRYVGLGTISDLNEGLVSYVRSTDTTCGTTIRFSMVLNIAERDRVFKPIQNEIAEKYCN